MKTFELSFRILSSPVGPLTLVASDQALVGLEWGQVKKYKNAKLADGSKNKILDRAEKQLKEYFEGRRKDFDLPLAPEGTEFQKSAWKQLSKIPFGKAISYGEQARRMGNPKAVRAVGGANGKNPIGIIVPCHRVIGADGSLTGFGGGLSVKRRLLELEGITHKN